MKIIIIALFLIAISIQVDAQSGQKNFIDQNYIEVIGVAELEVVPDEIYLQVMIDEKDNKGKESLEDLERKMIQKLQEIGIDVENQLSVKDLISNFQFYFLLKTDIFSAKEYEILVYDAKTAGQVIQNLEQIGISNISINRIDHSQLEEISLDLKGEAIQKAKSKAGLMAQSLDQNIGKAIFILELDDPAFNELSDVLQGRVAGVRIRGASSIYGSSAAPVIDFEKIKLESKVQVRFILE